MPQPTQHSLFPLLLLWIAILSVVQVVFIIFFFTAGHHSLSQKSSAVAPERSMHVQTNNTPSSPSEHGLLLGKGQMLTFQATQGGSQHTVSMKSDNNVILQGRINPLTCSTGLLGKVEELPAGSSLEVHLPTTEELDETLTHLDIIYMYKP